MLLIPLNPIPSQELTIQLENSIYNILIRESRGVMNATITRDNTRVISGARVVAGTPLINYRYLQDGDFIFLTENEAIPYYTQFGIDQFLLYVTAEELESYYASA